MGMSSSVEDSDNNKKELKNQLAGTIVDYGKYCDCKLKNTCARYKERIAEVEQGIITLEEIRVKLYKNHQCQHVIKGEARCDSFRETKSLMQFMTLNQIRKIKNLIETNIPKKYILDYIECLSLRREEAIRVYNFLIQKNFGKLDENEIYQIVWKRNIMRRENREKFRTPTEILE